MLMAASLAPATGCMAGAAVGSPGSHRIGRRRDAAAGGDRVGDVHAVHGLGARTRARRCCGFSKPGPSAAVCSWWSLVLLARFTVWGRQYWRVTGDYFKGRQSIAGVGLVRGAAAVGDDVGAHRRAAQLLQQRSVLRHCRSPSRAPPRATTRSGSPASTASGWRLSHLRDPGDHLRQPGDARHLPDPALHHPLAGLADRPADLRLARRPRLLPQPVHRPDIDNPDQRIQQDIDIFTAGVGSSPNTPIVRHLQHAGVRRGQSVVTVVSFAAILWNLSGPLTLASGITLATALFWVVLVYVRVRHGGRVLDRPSADPAELPQRADQRRLPLRPGAAARRRRGGRLLPRRATPSAAS